ncbi:hypothetical protein GCM10023351_01090 [Microbacterium gilvum]|uniref:Uncharacterized protein n=1 Tax=Microbacterium gilvum TaxID=1336204 RepID=A0ABP8ZR66_9MICO
MRDIRRNRAVRAMSAGPISQERAAHKPPTVSTTDAARVCGPTQDPSRGYCGRKATGAKRATGWNEVTCADCMAARRADEEERR